MAHYVMIDNNSGYIWGEAHGADPISACRIMDKEIGGCDREYDTVPRFSASTESGYIVHEAPADWTPVGDGRSESEIERVSALPIVAYVAFTIVSDL